MTQLRLLTTPPDGHGFTSKMLDQIYRDLTSGRDLGGQYLVVAIVTPATTSQRRTAKGIKRFVGAEFVRLEVIHDEHLAEQCRFALAKAYELRTGGRQLGLEFDGAPEVARRRDLFEAFAEYRRDNDLSEDELVAEWRNYIQPTEGASVPAMAQAPTQHLLEFALYCGAIVDEKYAGQPALPEQSSPMALRPIEELFDDSQGEPEPEGEKPDEADADRPDGDQPDDDQGTDVADQGPGEQAPEGGEPSIDEAAAEAAARRNPFRAVQ